MGVIDLNRRILVHAVQVTAFFLQLADNQLGALTNTGTRFTVSFGDRKVTSVLYDIDVIGYENGCNKLLLTMKYSW